MNTEQFAASLFRGLGRPYLHLQRHDSAPYHETLLHACIYNSVYDRQFVGSRAVYLSELIALTHHEALFEQRIIDAFAIFDDTMDHEQLFDFALLYAQAGNQQARHLMYEQFSMHAGDGSNVGATQLIDLDGIEGFRYVALRLGEASRLDPNFWDSDSLIRHLKERMLNVTDDDITALSAAEISIQRYLDVVAETEASRKEASRQRQSRWQQSYAQLKANVSTARKHIPYAPLKRWGRSASDEDIEAAAQDLLEQDDPVLLAAYLAIFGQRLFPLGITPLLPFVWHTDERVARWALDALSLFRDPTLRDTGLQLIRDTWHTSDALKLFILNYQPGDEKLFIALLDVAQTEDDVHALGFGLMDILITNPVARAADLLCSLYERQPCSLCRTKVVQQLITLRSLPDWMLHECLYDEEEDTRNLVQHHQSVM